MQLFGSFLNTTPMCRVYMFSGLMILKTNGPTAILTSLCCCRRGSPKKRVWEQAIDLANHVIIKHKMGIPASSAESFELLQKKNVIDQRLKEKLKNMVHFGNAVIHDYQRVNLDIVKSVINSELNDLVLFGDRIMVFVNSHSS